MILECVVMREWKDRPYRTKQGVEVQPHVLTLMETGEAPMLQLVDYALRPEELGLFGTLHAKKVRLKVSGVRNIFAGRARLDGELLVASDGKAAR